MNEKIGVAWFRVEQWQRLRDISADKQELEDTFEEWLVAAEKALVNLRANGVDARKVDVDVDQLFQWCQSKKLPVNSESRSSFVAEKLLLDEKKN